MRPGARSSSVENVLARRAGLRVQQSITPEPILIRLGRRGERGHRHDRVAHQPAVGLPHRVEALRLGVLDELDPLADRVGILQVQRDGIVHRASLARHTRTWRSLVPRCHR